MVRIMVFYCRLSLRERTGKRYFRGAKGDTIFMLSKSLLKKFAKVLVASALVASVLIGIPLRFDNSRLLAQDASLTRFERVASVVSARGNERKLCTAFFVRHMERMYLASAKHSSLETNVSTEIGLPSIGALRIFRLADTLKVGGSDPWTVHKSADLAICELDLSKLSESIAKQVRSMSITPEDCDRKLPQRSRRIECVGFPLGIGVAAEQISPLVSTCFVASEGIKYDGTWGKEYVFFASPAVGAGTSGGIVTLHLENPSECRVVGMHLGNNFDDSGAKLTRILPASVLVDFIESQAD